jgi:hypothetical protein
VTAMSERVIFRLMRMPCCGHMLCWVNPRRPNYCPECGTPFLNWGDSVLHRDENALLCVQ